MTAQKQQRKLLEAYTAEVRTIELTEAAISLLEQVDLSPHLRCVKTLKRQQVIAVRRLDKLAAQLGAPYDAMAGGEG